MSAARPYPYERWPRFDADQAAALRLAARSVPADRLGVEHVARELLGCECAAVPVRLDPCDADQLASFVVEPTVAIVIVPGRATPGARVVLELDPRLAACVVDRALGGEGGEGVPAPTRSMADAERGVLLYVVARLLASASARPHRAAAVLTTATAMRAALGARSASVWTLELAVGTDRGLARLWLPSGGIPDALPAARLRPALRDLPLWITASVGGACVERRDLDSLRPGDVILLDHAWARPAADGTIAGHARVSVVGARRTIWRCRVEAGRLVVEDVSRGVDPPVGEGRREREMDDGEDGAAEVLARVGDAPVEVSVEVARFRLSLDDLAALHAGEIVRTGRRVGDRVVLRAADRAVALGELVDVEGEVGVRLLKLGG